MEDVIEISYLSKKSEQNFSHTLSNSKIFAYLSKIKFHLNGVPSYYQLPLSSFISLSKKRIVNNVKKIQRQETIYSRERRKNLFFREAAILLLARLVSDLRVSFSDRVTILISVEKKRIKKQQTALQLCYCRKSSLHLGEMRCFLATLAYRRSRA